MTTQDARERAWEMFRETYPNLTWSEFATAYDEGHADGRREDEQRIAALEEAAGWWLLNTGPHYDENGLPNRVRRALGMEPFPVCTCSSCSDVRARALAGEEEG